MFNSRDSLYKNPVGAVGDGTKIHFRICLDRNISCRGAFLITENDKSEKEVHDMFWCGMNGDDKEWWECHFTPEEIGVYFYYFELRTDHGLKNIFKGLGGKSDEKSTGNRWQLTVYDKNYKTPNWLSGGIMYQIFPDRFHYSGKEKTDIPYGRTLRNWGETPEWKPNAEGEITNSDYFMGDLLGIEKKLPYLKSLGVTCIYLNPIFEAHSNHRYNTADYSKIDPLLGTKEDFENLCKSATEFGMKILLDGVFSHTGSDSVYFNREKRYNSIGAYNSKTSKYYNWYNFRNWPDDYESWWNFITLPNLDEENDEYANYITGKNGIIETWLNNGASGWRLDVADELPDSILDKIYTATKQTNPENIVLGEVWEDASNKLAYGFRRRYLLGKQMDTVMNYPFREAILGFLCGNNSEYCMEQIESILENYPPQTVKLLMNIIGTHDTERAISIIAGKPVGNNGREWQNENKLSKTEYQIGVSKLKLASLLQFTLPGVPCIYYGDEAGLESYKDPFNRACYPWGNENESLINWYKNLKTLRENYSVFKEGNFKNIYSQGSIMCFERCDIDEKGNEVILLITANRSRNAKILPFKLEKDKLVLGIDSRDGELTLPPYSCSVLKLKSHIEI